MRCIELSIHQVTLVFQVSGYLNPVYTDAAGKVSLILHTAQLGKMKGTKVQTLGERAVAGAWLVAWAIMAMGAIINTHAHR